MRYCRRMLALLLAVTLLCGALPVYAAALDTVPTFTNDLKTYETVALNTDMTLSVTVTDAESYQWESSADKTTWTGIDTATGSSYKPVTASAGSVYYRVTASNNVGSVTSNIVNVTVLPEGSTATVSFGFNADNTVECEVGDSKYLTASASGGTEIYYEWFQNGESKYNGKSATSFFVDTSTTGEYSVCCVATIDRVYNFESDHIKVQVRAAETVPEKAYDFDFIPSNQGGPDHIYIAGASVSAVNPQSQDMYTEEYGYGIQLDPSVADDEEFSLFFRNETEEYRPGYGCYPVISKTGDEFGTRIREITTVADAAFRKLDVKLSGGKAQVIFYVYDNDIDYTRGGRSKFILDFSNKEQTAIIDATPSVGQWENKSFLFTKKSAYLIVPYGTATVDVTLTLDAAVAGVKVNNGDQQPVSEEKTCAVTINASPNGIENTIEAVTENGTVEDLYKIICIAQKYTALPDYVSDYLCIGSQYTNGTGLDDYGMRGVRSLVGSNYDAGGGLCGPVSLGNFGGYITYYYKDAIYDDPDNPYGIDFITYGNSFSATRGFGEPGQVWVSENGTDWYALAGSLHYDNGTDWNYTITYTRLENGRSKWEDSMGRSVIQPHYEYPLPENYPQHTFAEGDEESITLTGIYLDPDSGTNEYGNTLPPFADFGYTDVGAKGTWLEGDTDEGLTSEEIQAMFARNIAGNPYQGNEGTITATDGMDLAWAVDAEGRPVTFPNGIHYVKIVTASNIDNSAIGEKSTEVNMVRVAAASENAVGMSSEPTNITVDGKTLTMESGKYIYDNVVVDGPFVVRVNAADGANIYINSSRTNSAIFGKMPDHEMIRVIVQEEEKEPVIYYLNLVETTDNPESVATLTLDPNGGTLDGSSEVSNYAFDAHMTDITLPNPTTRNENLEFAGWYSTGQEVYTTYPSEVKDLTLTARWEDISSGEPTKDINVSFRLIGSTLANLEDEFDTIDLADGDYKGAEYVNWIATKNYTLPAGSTVRDLFEMALTEAGLTWKNPGGDYITTINAPDEYGGYELSEMTNGSRSGWMYTLNGDHALLGVSNQQLSEGDEIIFHYVNDYAYEVHDWGEFGGTPPMGDGIYWSKWLEAADDTLASNESDVAEAKTAIESLDYILPMDTANTEAAVMDWIEAEIAKLDLNGVTADLVIGSFTPAIAATESNPGGTEGSFTFTVNLSKGEGEILVSDSLQISGRVTVLLPGDIEEAQKVDGLIAEISDPVTLDDKEAIDAARAAYNALTDTQKDLVTKLQELQAAEAKLGDLQAAKAVEDKIMVIGTVTLESKSAIEEARAAYDALPTAQAELVTNYQTLIDAETAYVALVAEQEDAEAAKKVDDLIAAVSDPVTLADKAKIEEARAAYNALTDSQKNLVTKLEQLQNAEAALEDLEAAKEVDDQIASISDPVTLADKEAIEEARVAYDALTPAQADLVSNYQTLTAAEAAYAALVAEKEDADAAKEVDDLIAEISDPVTLADKVKIEEARAAYNALTDPQKNLVTKLDQLEAAETTLANLLKPVQAAEKQIAELPAALGDTEGEMLALYQASRAFDELTAEQRAALSPDLQAKLAALQKQAAQLNHTSNGVQIQCLPWNIILTAEPIGGGAEYEAMKKEAENKLGTDRTILGMYDLTLQKLTADGLVEYLLDGETATITITIPDLAKYKEIKIIHQLADGSFEYIELSQIEGNKVTFIVKSLSNYAIVGQLAKKDTEPVPTPGDEQGKPSTEDKEKKAPKTGDFNSVLPALLLLVALCAGSYLYCRKGRGENRS